MSQSGCLVLVPLSAPHKDDSSIFSHPCQLGADATNRCFWRLELVHWGAFALIPAVVVLRHVRSPLTPLAHADAEAQNRPGGGGCGGGLSLSQLIVSSQTRPW